jgi:hypothetical protein
MRIAIPIPIGRRRRRTRSAHPSPITPFDAQNHAPTLRQPLRSRLICHGLARANALPRRLPNRSLG